jgi:hypothetical protein
MAWLHAQQPTNPQTVSTICAGTRLNYSSITKSITKDYPEVFSRHPVYGGITLSGKYPGDEPFDLDALVEKLGFNEKIASTIPKPTFKEGTPSKFQKQYYDKGWTYLNRKGIINETLLAELHIMLNAPQIWNTDNDMFARHYNMVRAYYIVLQSLMSRDREARFNQLVERPKHDS